MDYATATQLVLEDQRQGDVAEGYTDAELIAGVRDSMTLPGVRAHGAWEVQDDESDLAAAYILILATEDPTATIERLNNDQTALRRRMAEGHYIRNGHTLTGYFVTVGGIATLIRTCDHD